MKKSKWTGSAWGILGWRLLLLLSFYFFIIPMVFVLPKYLKWYYAHATIDGEKLEFREDGPHWGLLGWLVFSIITLGFGSWYATKRMTKWELARVHIVGENKDSDWTGSAMGLFGYQILSVLSIYLFFIPYLFVFVTFEKWSTKHWVLDARELEFQYEGAYWDLIGWLFLTIITLGLASWFVEKKITQWSFEYTHFKYLETNVTELDNQIET